MGADDGNGPKGRILKILESRGGTPVGDIKPVSKRLRELMAAHEAGTSPVSGRQMSIQCYTSKWDKGPSEDSEVPGEDLLRGLKIGPPVIEVPVKKKPGEPGESPPDTRHPERTTPEMKEYLRLRWERDVSPFFMELWSELPGELREMLEGDGRLDEKGRADVVVRLYWDSLGGNSCMFDSSERGLRGLAYFEAFGELVRIAIDEHLKRMSGAEYASEWEKGDKPARDAVERASSAVGRALKKAADSGSLGPYEPGTPSADEVRESVDRAIRAAGLANRVAKAVVPRPTQATPIVFDPNTGKPVLKGRRSPHPASPDPKKAHPVRRMLDKDKRLDDADKDAIMDAVSKHGWADKKGETIGDALRKAVEEYLESKRNAPKTTLQIDLEAAVRILKEFCSDMAVLDRMEKEGWLSPFLDEPKRLENGWLIPAFRPVQIYWHTEAEVLESVRVIPESRLDDAIPGGMTVRELLKAVADSSVFESVRSAAMEKLHH